MSQLLHARALHLLEDTGLDADDARYVMKRLYDMGFTFRPADTTHSGGAPPAGDPPTPQARASLFAQMRADVEAARVATEAKIAAAVEAERDREEEAKRRALAVAQVLAEMDRAVTGDVPSDASGLVPSS